MIKFIYRLTTLTVAMLVLSIVFMNSAAVAISADQKKLFKGGIYYYDIDECAAVGSASPNTGTATGKIYMIGDSVTEGTKPELVTAFTEKGFTEVIVDGLSSRRLSQGGDGLDGVGVLERSTSQIADANTVVIALGTNGGVSADNITKSVELVTAAAPGAKIYWVNIGIDNTKRNTALDAESINNTLQQNSDGKYTIIDWASQVAAHPDYIATDGIGAHPSATGKVPFASTVAQGAIAGGAVPVNGANPNCACSAEGSTVSLVGSDNAEKVYNFFVGKGLQPFQAAGIMGNMMAESSIEPMRLQGTAPGVETPASEVGNRVTGWGLVQWTPGSKMINPTIEAGKDPNDLGVQLEFVWDQLEGRGPIPEQNAGDRIKASTTVEEATAIFERYYERPAQLHPELRSNFSRGFLAQYGSNTGGTASGSKSGCGGGGNGQVSGGYSLPLDRKWYDEHPEWFTKPHHTYPAADIPVPTGTPVYSMTAGKVIRGPTSGACGIGLIIEAAPGILFTYCHGTDGGSVDGARQGDTVQPGQLIMHSASTGRSSGPHLHLSIDIGTTRHCPQELFVGIVNGSPPALDSLPAAGCVN